MNLNTITLLSLLAAVLSAVALLIFDWVYLIFPVITGVVCFLDCFFLIFLRAIGASGPHKGSATEFSQINFGVEKSTHIQRAGIISMIAPIAALWLMIGVGSWLISLILGSWVMWVGGAFAIWSLFGLAYMFEGECPSCGSGNFDVAEAAELGITTSQLKRFQQGGTVSSLSMTSQNILRCQFCLNWIVVKTDTGQAIQGNSQNLPFIRRWNSVLPSSGFRLPGGCICCGEQATSLVNLTASNTAGTVSASEGVGVAASLAGGSFVGKLASAAELRCRQVTRRPQTPRSPCISRPCYFLAWHPGALATPSHLNLHLRALKRQTKWNHPALPFPTCLVTQHE